MERSGRIAILLVWTGSLALSGCGRTGLGLEKEDAVFGAAGASAGGGAAAGPAAGSASAATSGGGSAGAHSNVTCDHDADGYQSSDCEGDDCDDSDPGVHPGALDSNAVAGGWHEELVFGDIQGDSRGTTSIAVDRAGVAHLTEGRHGLRYANNARGWRSEHVDENSLGVPSLALSPDGTVNIAYATSNEVRLATRTSGMWATEAIPTLNPGPLQTEGACSLASDREGRLHLVLRTGSVLRYATRTEGTWSVVARYDSSDVVTPALAIDALGTPHFVFGGGYGNEALLYATHCGASFCLERIAEGVSRDADVAVDDGGVVHVVYGMQRLGSELLHRFREGGGTWREDVVAASASWAVDLEASPPGSAATVQLTYLGNAGSDFEVSYARREGDVWLTEQVATNGYGVSLALEGANVVHIARTDFRFDLNTFVGYVTNRELVPDGIDQNCDGVDGVDADGDGYAAVSTGGTDCDDDDSSVHLLSADGGCEG